MHPRCLGHEIALALHPRRYARVVATPSMSDTYIARGFNFQGRHDASQTGRSISSIESYKRTRAHARSIATESDRAGNGNDGDEAMQDDPTVRYASRVTAIQMEEFGTLDGRMFAKQQAAVSEVGVTRKHGMPDEPKKRRRLRIICIVLTGMFIVGAILGLVSGATYYDAIMSPSKATITQGARYVLRY